jgi:hypothetical protein
VDLASAEKAEAQLDAFIEKRAREARDAQKVEELWAESARRHREKKQRENGIAWLTFHARMERQFLELAAEHHEKGERVLAAVEKLKEED